MSPKEKEPGTAAGGQAPDEMALSQNKQAHPAGQVKNRGPRSLSKAARGALSSAMARASRTLSEDSPRRKPTLARVKFRQCGE
jgi:hypothetical protein